MTLKDDNEVNTDKKATEINSKLDAAQSFLRSVRSGNKQKVVDYLDNGGEIATANANGLNALHIASKEGLEDLVKLLITRSADVNTATKKGNTALHIASLAGKADVVNLLIDHGAKVNVQSQNGFTPLYMASQENHVEVVKLLLLNSASQTLATDDGFTPLAVALQQGHEKVVAILLENDSRGRIRLPALHIAAKKDDVKAANLLLTNEADVDHQSASGFTPLHIAAHYGNVNIANLLIERGGDVNFQAKNNITPLHVATKWGNLGVTERIVEKGAQLECKTRDGLTPLHCAVRSGYQEVVAYLLKSGANHAAKTRSGLTALHMASQGDHVDCGQLLIQHNANINDLTMDFLTPLHVSAHCGHVRMSKLLIDRSCEINARALNGFTPLHIACKKNNTKVVELLLKCGSAVEATTESGLSALHVAAFMGHLNVALMLIQSGANPNLCTVRCETSLHLATRAGQEEMIKLLLKNGALVDARAKEQQTPLHIAARLGNVAIIQLLLQSGASPNQLTKDNYSTLHIAAKEEHVEVARILIEAGAKLELTTRKGFTALHIAAKYGKVALAKLLLQLGTDPNVQGRNGLTPLHLAVHYSSMPMTELLIEFQASPFKTSKNGYTPLHIAARKNLVEIAEKLILHKSNPNAESRNGFTPLHLCSQEGHDDMTSLLIKHGADANAKAKNLLSCMHLAAQEDRVSVAEILDQAGCEIDSKTKAGYTPLHTACHFGKLNIIRFLLRHNSEINVQTNFGSTAMHLAAQQGHHQVINLLLEHHADPNIRNSQNLTAAHVAFKQHYLNIFEVLKRVVTIVTRWDEDQDEIVFKMELERPEMMGENPVSDSEDEYGDPDYTTIPASPLFARPSMTSSGNTSSMFHTNAGSLPYSKQSTINKSQSDKNSTISGEDSIHEGFSGEYNHMMRNGVMKENIVPSKIKHDFASAVNDWDYAPDNVPISRKPVTSGFLVSFLVDARGGSMRGSRHAGLRIMVPPSSASAPTRVTCRMLGIDRVAHPPQLNDGEGLACRIIEMGPHPCKFNSPVLLEIPHFASLRNRDREIVILRCDNGDVWKEHSLEITDQSVIDSLGSAFEEALETTEELQTKRIVRILTTDFPVYFAIITRLRQETAMIGSDGGVISSSVIPQVQAVFPEGALQKRIKVGLQAHSMDPELVVKLLGNRVAVSPIVTIEPRRRKFHKPITVTIPLPQTGPANRGMINSSTGSGGGPSSSGPASNDQLTASLRLLCSISGGTNPAQWEDITGSTPLSHVKQSVSFTTTVSARFWLMDCPNPQESADMAGKLYKEAILVPYMGKFVIFAKRTEFEEVLIRCFCITDDKIDKTLECQEGFELKAASPEVEVLDRRDNWLETAGNIIPVTKLGDQLRLHFSAFRENRLPFPARLKEPGLEHSVGKIAFMRDPRNFQGFAGSEYGGGQSVPQKPLCTLEVDLSVSPAATTASAGEQPCQHGHTTIPATNGKLELDSKGRPLNEEAQKEWNNIDNEDDAIARSELDLGEVAQEVGSDWPAVGRELGIPEERLTEIRIADLNGGGGGEEARAMLMLAAWAQTVGEAGATGNELDRALRRCGREDVVKTCMRNFGRVTGAEEQKKAKNQMKWKDPSISVTDDDDAGDSGVVDHQPELGVEEEDEEEEPVEELHPRGETLPVLRGAEAVGGGEVGRDMATANPQPEGQEEEEADMVRESESMNTSIDVDDDSHHRQQQQAQHHQEQEHDKQSQEEQLQPDEQKQDEAEIDINALNAFDEQLQEISAAQESSESRPDEHHDDADAVASKPRDAEDPDHHSAPPVAATDTQS